MTAWLRKYRYRLPSRRIIRGLDLTVSDDPLIEAFNAAKSRGQIGDLTFSEFSRFRSRGSATPIGFCGIKVMQFHQSEVNLFYRFDPVVWGNGIASEAAAAVTGWAAANIPDRALIARIRPQNAASQRVATRAGLACAEDLDTLREDGADWIFVPARP